MMRAIAMTDRNIKQPSWEVDEYRRLLAGDAICLRREIRIFKHENASDRHLHVAQGSLSQWRFLRFTQEYLRPRFGIDVNTDVESDGRRGCLVGLNDVGPGFSEILESVFELMNAGG